MTICSGNFPLIFNSENIPTLNVDVFSADLVQAINQIRTDIINGNDSSLILRMKKEDWDFVLEANLTGIYRLCRAVVPTMIRSRHGGIVNITSHVSGSPWSLEEARALLGYQPRSVHVPRRQDLFSRVRARLQPMQ